MAAPNPARQRASLATLDGLFRDSANVWIIHYSCESFYERPDGSSPRITSIALRKLDSAQTVSFSIHQVAERRKIPSAQIDQHYDELEKEMLIALFAHIGSHRGMKYLHWNMRDANYGFQAIEHRFQVLGGDPYVVDDAQKFDLSRLLIDIYGVGYIDHPRMEKLLEKNDIAPRDFLTGKQEAKAFENRDFVALHQSTLRKVDVIANIAGRAHDRNLKTYTTWWEMRGGHARAVLFWMGENRTFQVVAGVASIAGLALALWALA
ncbi:hypothetical protein SH611_20715 [Geminicoccaceae bacterium 1502E]|nr:hypothetical protein [Geminicoccaceae bacterium 1502E]